MTDPQPMDGQLSEKERELITRRLRDLRPAVCLEVGTWLGGGDTLHVLRALEANGRGHLWGIEAYAEIFDRMVSNLRSAGPDLVARFTPLQGFSEEVIPRWLAEREAGPVVDFVFLDGGDNPLEQVREFQLLDPVMPVGAVLLSHDAKLRKGKWLGPYVSALDHWRTTIHDLSDEGVLEAVKVAEEPTEESARVAGVLLRRLRRDPVEWLGRITPSPLIDFALRLVPYRWVKGILHGR